MDVDTGVGVVTEVASLPFGEGTIGANTRLRSPEAKELFARNLRTHTHRIPLSDQLQADCIDDRPILRTGSGISDPAILRRRVRNQLPGGTGLAVAKAAIAADAVFLQGTKDLREACEISHGVLKQLKYRNGGHPECGASINAKPSIARALPLTVVHSTLEIVTGNSIDIDLLANEQAKQRRLQDGFYDGWSPSWYEGFLEDNDPDDFLILDSQAGHQAPALYLPDEGYGLARNEFTEETGDMAFAMSRSTVMDLAHKLGGSDEERARLALAFFDDALHVSNVLMAEGQTVFA